MAAGLGFKDFTTGEVLTAADVDGYLMQGIWVFANAAARDAAVTSPQEGNCCYLKDTDAVQTYSGTAWVGFDDSNAIQNSIVDAKGDIVAASGNDTPARLAVGNNGETLVADSSTSTGLRWQSGVNGNGIINGGFDIWQRGTSFTGTNNYTADRWQYFSSSSGRTISRQTTSDTTNLPFIQYAIRLQRDSGNSNTSVLTIGNSNESVESYKFSGRTIVLSFYARAGANYSATSSGLGVFLKTGTGTDQNVVTVGYTGSANTISQTATLTTTWQRFSYSATLPSTTTEYAVQFEFTPTGTASTNDWCEITGVQVELGATPSAFKRAGGTLQGELAACMRYCQRYDSAEANGNFNRYAMIQCETTTAISGNVVLPVPMRTAPSITTTGTASNYAIYHAGTTTACNIVPEVLSNGSNPRVWGVYATVASGLTAGRAGELISNNNKTSYILLTAEL